MSVASGPSCDRSISYGQLDRHGIDSLRESVDILVACNRSTLASETDWRAFLWRRGRHWEVVIQPICNPFDARIDSDLLQEFSPQTDGEVEVYVASKNLFLIFDLITPGESRNFALRLKVSSLFDPNRENVQHLGTFENLRLHDISERAIQVISTFDSYGMIGGNCQHFALEFVSTLGIEDDTLMPEDERAAKVTGRFVRAGYIAGGAVKGTMAVGAGGCLGLLAGHVVVGAAIACAGYAVVDKGYQYACECHRNRHNPATGSEVPDIGGGTEGSTCGEAQGEVETCQFAQGSGACMQDNQVAEEGERAKEALEAEWHDVESSKPRQ